MMMMMMMINDNDDGQFKLTNKPTNQQTNLFSSTIPSINGCDVVVVDKTLPPTFLFSIYYHIPSPEKIVATEENENETKETKETKDNQGKWYIKVANPNIEMKVDETTLTFLSIPYPLGVSSRVVVGKQEFFIEFACEE